MVLRICSVVGQEVGLIRETHRRRCPVLPPGVAMRSGEVEAPGKLVYLHRPVWIEQCTAGKSLGGS